MKKTTAHSKTDYAYFFELTTRWMDNDIYGHVNNVVYYSYFDTIVNHFLIIHGGLNIHDSPSIGLMVHSQCSFHTSIAFPDKITGAFKVTRLGNSSVEYDLAIFPENQDTACAQGRLTHVFVDRISRRPQPITGKLRAALTSAVK